MLKSCAVILLAAFLAGPADGANEPPGTPVLTEAGAAPSKWSLGVALGYGLRTNPLIQSDDIPILVDLDIGWFGDHFFFDNGDVGVTVADNEWFTLSFVGRFNSDRVFFGLTDTRFIQVSVGEGNVADVAVEVPDRDYAIEAGTEFLTGGPWGLLQLTAFQDLSGTHGGYQLGAAWGYGVRRQRWYFEPGFSVSFKSSELNDYYWGVRQDEASLALPPYTAGSGINLGLRLVGSYQLTRHWAITAVAEYERINDEAAASPIVAEDHVTGFFAGFAWRF